MSKKWRSYKHRFIPWLALNWRTRSVKRVELTSDLAKEAAAITQLHTLLSSLGNILPPLTVREYCSLLKSSTALSPLAEQSSSKMYKLFGFKVQLKESAIPGGGRGVFLSEDSCPVQHGQLVSLYPGAIYLPFEPVFLQSLGNPFLFRCADGWIVDGYSRGVSHWIYKSCAYRDLIGPHLSCDLTWLTDSPLNPLSIGQYVNNHSQEFGQNVEYVELSLPPNFPLHLRRFLPNVFYGSQSEDYTSDHRMLRLVALMATRTIQPKEELYSSYLTLVTDR